MTPTRPSIAQPNRLASLLFVATIVAAYGWLIMLAVGILHGDLGLAHTLAFGPSVGLGAIFAILAGRVRVQK